MYDDTYLILPSMGSATYTIAPFFHGDAFFLTAGVAL